jgi:hypothetical protein
VGVGNWILRSEFHHFTEVCIDWFFTKNLKNWNFLGKKLFFFVLADLGNSINGLPLALTRFAVGFNEVCQWGFRRGQNDDGQAEACFS